MELSHTKKNELNLSPSIFFSLQILQCSICLNICLFVRWANALSANEVPHALANHAWLALDLVEGLC